MTPSLVTEAPRSPAKPAPGAPTPIKVSAGNVLLVSPTMPAEGNLVRNLERLGYGVETIPSDGETLRRIADVRSQVDVVVLDKRGAKPPWQRDRFAGLRTAALIIVLIALAAAGAYGIIRWINRATEQPMIDKIKTEALSPDGKHRAFTILHIGPPMPFTGVKLQPSARKPDPHDRAAPMVFAMQYELPLRMRWDSPTTLTVFYPTDVPHAQLLVQATTCTLGLNINYVGEEMFKGK